MSEEIKSDETTPIKRGPGRPRKVQADTPAPQRERSVAPRHKMKAKPNWDDDDISGLGEESPDRLGIAPELVPEGMSLQWVTDSVYGQQVPQHRARFEKRGWTPVHQEDFDGAFDGMFMARGAPGEIKVDGMVLMARPAEMTRKATLDDRRKA